MFEWLGRLFVSRRQSGDAHQVRFGYLVLARGESMADRFDKFTERSRRVLTHAQEEAQRFKHNYIGTEHILLGLCREQDGVAARVLGNLGVKLEMVREAVEFIVGRGERPSPTEIGLTPRAKKVVELAVEEARRLNHSHIGTEHLLLGLIREGQGIAFGVLESLGVSLERVRVETIGILSQPSSMSRMSASQPHRWALVQLAPDARRRNQAADLINGTKELLAAHWGTPVEQTFVRGFLIPRLDRLWHALSESLAPDEAEKRRAEVMAEASILGDLAEAFRAEGSNDVADALTAALGGLKEALLD
jgi:hypothetical protein